MDDLCAAARPLGFGTMRNRETIDGGLRLLAAGSREKFCCGPVRSR